ncbi:MAG: BMP family ABC transporter substrate-binding protein [Lachnospiraceae bacterium]
MKKLIAFLLAVVMVFALVGCGSEGGKNTTGNGTGTSDGKDMKVGFIFIGDENDGYTYAFYKGALALTSELGISKDNIIIKWNIPESEEAYEAACELADEGCSIVFANSYGHEEYVMQAAEEYPDVQFCHATGDKAKDSGLSNFHNYYVSVEESRFVSGVVAGYKLNEMIAAGDITADEAIVGYVGAFAFAQVISGFDAFYLGVKSVCPEATMVVKYTNTWGDQATEYDVAKALIEEEDCVLISQHSNTTGPSSACEELGVYCVGYNISMIDTAPNYALTSASLDWAPYTVYAVKCVMEGKDIGTDWCEGYDAGACMITEVNEKAFSADTYAEVTAKVTEVESGLKDGSVNVFDVSTFTVDGAELGDDTVDSFGQKPVFDGVYHESYYQAAPGAVFIVDGITELD